MPGTLRAYLAEQHRHIVEQIRAELIKAEPDEVRLGKLQRLCNAFADDLRALPTRVEGSRPNRGIGIAEAPRDATFGTDHQRRPCA